MVECTGLELDFDITVSLFHQLLLPFMTLGKKTLNALILPFFACEVGMLSTYCTGRFVLR